MLPSSKKTLNASLTGLSMVVDQQMLAVTLAAEAENISPFEMRYADGHYVLMPLLLAQAQILNAQVHLNKE